MKIKGVIEKIVFQASDSNYKILDVKTDNKNLTVVGYFPKIFENEYYEFTGQTKLHAKYGVQFEAESYVSLANQTKHGVISYLSGGRFKGVGKKTAEKIVDLLGIKATDLIKKDRNVLKEIGLKQNKIDSIYNAIIENAEIESIFMKLASFGLTPNMSNRIYQKYEGMTITKIEENPYCLINDVDGFGFNRCDNLALNIGFKEDNIIRIKEAILYSLNEKVNSNGYTFLTINQLLETSTTILNNLSKSIVFKSEKLNTYVSDLINDGKIYSIDNRVYPKYLFEAETQSASIFKKLINSKPKTYDLDKLNSLLSEEEKYLNIKLTIEQKKAIINSINSKVSIITGGPGTGKTTILKCLLHLKAALLNLDIVDDEFRNKVLLLAPTGRAAKRMQVQTEIPSFTIHKGLGYNQEGEFEHDETNKLSQNIIVIDESSMIDISLLYNLLKAIRFDAQIVFLGDANQLPSVGPGNVFYDMINSDIFKISYLTEIMRQKEDSNIIKLANMVNDKHIDFSIFHKKNDVFFYNVEDYKVNSLIIKILDRYIKSGHDFYNEMQVLAPMYSSMCGIDRLNVEIQEKFNDSKIYVKYGDKIFKEKDKVLQLVNSLDYGIMNGDTGIIRSIEKNDEGTFLYIDFDNIIVKYDAKNLSNLTLGYAISIHKSQGSEYKNVIIPVVKSFKIMLNKKLLYTAITRAKEKVIIIGDANVFSKVLYRDDQVRQTSLMRYLNPDKFSIKVENKPENNLKNDNIKMISDSQSAFDYVDENLEGITPYSFMDNKEE